MSRRPRAQPVPALADVSPADASLFHAVTQAIRKKGRSDGWTRARDLILDHFPTFEQKWGGYQSLKAALEIDRHAMFAEVQETATEGRFKREVWDQFQAFLKGDIATPPPMRGTEVSRATLGDALEEPIELGPTEEEE